MQLIGCCLIFMPPRQPNEIIFDEGRFLLIRSPTDEAGLTFESARMANTNDASAGGYSSCEDQDVIPPEPQQMDLTYKQAFRSKEFALVSLLNVLLLYG